MRGKNEPSTVFDTLSLILLCSCLVISCLLPSDLRFICFHTIIFLMLAYVVYKDTELRFLNESSVSIKKNRRRRYELYEKLSILVGK